MKKAESHGEGWAVSYADFMTLIATFFMLLYATAEKPPKERKDYEKHLEKYFGISKLKTEKEDVDLTDANYLLMSVLNLDNSQLGDIQALLKTLGESKAVEKTIREALDKKLGSNKDFQKGAFDDPRLPGKFVEFRFQDKSFVEGGLGRKSLFHLKAFIDVSESYLRNYGATIVAVSRDSNLANIERLGAYAKIVERAAINLGAPKEKLMYQIKTADDSDIGDNYVAIRINLKLK